MTGDFLLPFPDQNLREKVALVNVATGLPGYSQWIGYRDSNTSSMSHFNLHVSLLSSTWFNMALDSSASFKARMVELGLPTLILRPLRGGKWRLMPCLHSHPLTSQMQQMRLLLSMPSRIFLVLSQVTSFQPIGDCFMSHIPWQFRIFVSKLDHLSKVVLVLDVRLHGQPA